LNRKRQGSGDESETEPHDACIGAARRRLKRLLGRQPDVLSAVRVLLLDEAVEPLSPNAVVAVGPRTVKKHLERIYDKLGVRTRAGAVAAAARSTSV
jgi:hypothetical protein